MHGKDGEAAVRRILGMLSLAKKYGAASVDDACGAVLEAGVCDSALCGAIWSATRNCP
jgi:hypothetical protein